MVIKGAADVALWLAIMALRGLDERWVTSDMHTGFPRGGRAVGSGELLAHHTMRYAKVATGNGE